MPDAVNAANVGLSHPFAAPASDGALTEVAPGLMWLRLPMPMALDHINVYLLRDGDGWRLVDTGLNTEATRAIWDRVFDGPLAGSRLTGVLCTHFHYDHAGLATWLADRFGVPLQMTLGEFHIMRTMGVRLPEPLPPEQARFYHRCGLDADSVERIVGVLRKDPFIPPSPQSFERIRDAERLSIGERTWQVVVGEGHTPEHACLYCADERILIAGDQLLPRVSSNVLVTSIEPEANPLGLWLHSLRKLDTLHPDTLVLPSHGDVFKGLHARSAELQHHHKRRLADLREQVEAAGECTASEAMERLFPRRRGPVDDMLALGETLAHLAWWRVEGTIERRLDEQGVWRFRCAADKPS